MYMKKKERLLNLFFVRKQLSLIIKLFINKLIKDESFKK